MTLHRTVLAWLVTVAAASATIPEHPHPRLLFPKRLEAAIRSQVDSDPVAAQLLAAILGRSDEILRERTCRYEIPDGKRLLRESRRALLNITHTSMAWRLTGDDKYRLRSIAELDAACALKDWNTTHFLDTAEMAAAVAIGYDWLHHTLTPEQRERYEDALIAKALRPAKAVHDSKGWWSRPRNNWSQVCGAGIGLAAAAVWDRDPELCEPLFESSAALVESCGSFYHPDGCYPEGPSYWHYGTNFHVLMLAACQALGEKVAVDPTLQRSGEFILQITGPTGYDYNFADAGSRRAAITSAQSWIATQFKDPQQCRAVRAAIAKDPERAADGRLSALHLLWLPSPPTGHAPALRTAARFGGEQPVAFLRTGWAADDAWLAIKGGTGAASHGHLDAGSFIYEALGVRWCVDLGSDNYNMPGYFGSKRWSYFRLNNRSHNTLVIDEQLQAAPREPCPITASGAEGSKQWLTIDLGPAYPKQADAVTRRAVFDASTGETGIEDTIRNPAGPVRWAILTDAGITIEGPRVTLEKAGKRVHLTRKDASGGEWTSTPATPPTTREKQNEGYRILAFTAPKADQLHLQVSLTPMPADR
jgi:hypothetical protein